MCQYQTSKAHGREHREAKTPPRHDSDVGLATSMSNQQEDRWQLNARRDGDSSNSSLRILSFFFTNRKPPFLSLAFTLAHTFLQKLWEFLLLLPLISLAPGGKKNKIKKGTFWSHQHFHGFSLSTHFLHYRLVLVFLSSFSFDSLHSTPW